MTSSEFSDTFYPTALDDLTASDGNIYALPTMFEGLGMFYNKSLFTKAGISAPPTDWVEFTDAANKLTVKDSQGNIQTAGAAIGTSNNINHSFDLFSVLLLQNGVEMMAADGVTATFGSQGINEDRAVKTLDPFYVGFADPDSEKYVWSDALGNDLQLFAEGKVAIMFAPSWRAFDVINLNAATDFDIAPLPQLPSSETTPQPTVNWGSYWSYGVSAKADNQLESWKFVKWLSEKEQQQQLHSESAKIRAFGEIYSRKDLAQDLRDQPYTDAFAQMAPTSTNWEMRDDEKASELFEAAISATLGGEGASKALKDAGLQLTNNLGGDPSQIQ